MKAISLKVRFTKKLILLIIGLVLVLTGSTAAFALYMRGESQAKEKADHSISGVACTTLHTIKLRRTGQRWVRKYVTTDSPDGVQRVRTALRVAALLAKNEKADLYQVVVFDQAGPTKRSEWRGAAIGAEVLFSPDPSKVPGMDGPFVARYTDAKPNTVGLFHGPEVELALADIQSTITGMEDKSDCFDAEVEAAKTLAEARANLGHGEAKSKEGHGEAPAHGEEAPAHGEEAAPAEADGHGETAPAHGEEAVAGEHAAAEPEKKGFIGSMMAMVFGSSDKEAVAPQAHGAAPAEAEHGAAAEPAPGHEATAETPAAEKGFFGGLLSKVMGGEEEAGPAAEKSHAPEAAAPAQDGGEHGAPVEHAAPAEHTAPVAHDAPDASAEHGAADAPEAHGTEEAPAAHDAANVPAEHGAGEAPVAHGTTEASAEHGAAEVPAAHDAVEAPAGHDAAKAPAEHGAAETPAH